MSLICWAPEMVISMPSMWALSWRERAKGLPDQTGKGTKAPQRDFRDRLGFMPLSLVLLSES